MAGGEESPSSVAWGGLGDGRRCRRLRLGDLFRDEPLFDEWQEAIAEIRSRHLGGPSPR